MAVTSVNHVVAGSNPARLRSVAQSGRAPDNSSVPDSFPVPATVVKGSEESGYFAGNRRFESYPLLVGGTRDRTQRFSLTAHYDRGGVENSYFAWGAWLWVRVPFLTPTVRVAQLVEHVTSLFSPVSPRSPEGEHMKKLMVVAALIALPFAAPGAKDSPRNDDVWVTQLAQTYFGAEAAQAVIQRERKLLAVELEEQKNWCVRNRHGPGRPKKGQTCPDPQGGRD